MIDSFRRSNTAETAHQTRMTTLGPYTILEKIGSGGMRLSDEEMTRLEEPYVPHRVLM